MGDPDEAPGSWLQISSALAIVVTWGVNQQMEDFPLCLSNKNKYLWTQRDGLAAKVLTLNAPGLHMGAGSNPSSSTSYPAPCLWPGKALRQPKPLGPTPT